VFIDTINIVHDYVSWSVG